MAYDEALADRIRQTIGDEGAITERKMFGGLAFLVEGNMAVAASGTGGMMVRVDPGESSQLAEQPGVSPMVMRGKPMAGWLLVQPDQLGTDERIAHWVDIGLAYAGNLPPKR